MAQREFDITIAADGTVDLHVKGFKGQSCVEIARFFEQVVGEIQAQQMTSEFYEPEEQVRFRIEQRT